MASHIARRKKLRGRRQKVLSATFTKDTGMPSKVPEGPSPPSKQERDSLLRADAGSWMNKHTTKSERRKQTGKGVATTAVITTSADKAEQRALDKGVVDQITGKVRGEGHAKKRTPQVAMPKDHTAHAKSEPVVIGTQMVTITVPGKKGVPKYVEIEVDVHAKGNPDAVAIDRVYGVEPCPRIPETVTFLDDSTKPRMIRKTLHKSQGGYTMMTAAEFNEDLETRTELRARKAVERAERRERKGGKGERRPAMFTWLEMNDMRTAAALVGKSAVTPRVEVTRYNPGELHASKVKANALARSKAVAKRTEARKHAKLAKREHIADMLSRKVITPVTGTFVFKAMERVVAAETTMFDDKAKNDAVAKRSRKAAVRLKLAEMELASRKFAA